MDFAYVVVPAIFVIIGVLAAWFAVRRMRFTSFSSQPRVAASKLLVPCHCTILKN